jgi:hypothetical protein
LPHFFWLSWNIINIHFHHVIICCHCQIGFGRPHATGK